MASVSKFPLVSYQPFRVFFQVLYASAIVLQLPYFAVRAAVPALRPHPEWSAKQTFMTCLVYRLLDLTSRVGIKETINLEPRKEGRRFQIVKPAEPEYYSGILASGDIKPETIGGTWFPDVPKGDAASTTIFLYFHGGAFIQGDGRNATCGLIVKKLLEKGGADAVFSVQYRLSGHGGQNPFPAALQDALSSYLYLLNNLHVPGNQIVLAGDSAGGNLAMALLLYLRNFGAATHVPAPKCAVLLSPWVAPFHYNMTDNPHRHTDFVPTTYPYWGANAYAGGWPNAQSDPYITQLGNPFRTVPIFANAGTAELFYERILKWAEEMSGIEGNVIEVNHEDAGVHDTFLSAEILGFEKSAWEVAAKVGEFVRKC
ncbi:alpha/beta hydrolase fold-3 domain-containing protein [Xylaria bambusicola]|uniref:alpha/beta hydrolase fold-3 domain-containing protein n=1 Tax=Xylaria bambusicola TaxID=326684 RepID=UPI002008CE84|nr:alpha/beta hydrolase fold-3 domain-containing protein [Xylaria bambusicola]KAI0527768.1 alpha/beta hydrolase fold-3 domain-containing protein [Xylaria bambusicola]